MDKKDVERKILEVAYHLNFYKIKSELCEKPDFVLCSTDGNEFGVEVTENFINESVARLEKRPGYRDKLIDEKKYIHKNDEKHLKVAKVAIQNQDTDTSYEVDCVVQKAPTFEEYIGSIKSRLLEKELKFLNYSKTISHVNLLIYDNACLFAASELDLFYSIFIIDDLRRIILNSSFNEVEFITLFKERFHLIPLKASLFLSRLYLFNKFWLSQLELQCLNENEYLTSLYYCLKLEGFKAIRIRKDKYSVELIYSGIGFLVINDKTDSFYINIYNNCRIIGELLFENFLDTKYSNLDLFEKYQLFLKEHIFNLPLARKIDDIKW